MSQIAAKVGRSERTVRRILDAAPARPLRPLTPDAADPPGGRPANGTPVEELAESPAS